MSKIARIYQGTNEIQKYYQGGVLQRLFFDWKHYIGNELNIEYAKECACRNVVIKGKTTIQGVPSDYTILDYIECTGTQYIDTGFKANTTTTKFVGAFTPTQKVMGALLGSRNGTASGPHSCNVFVLGEGKFRVDWANASYSGTEINYVVGTKYEMEITRGRLVINNTTKSYTNSASVDQLGNFLIGTFNNVTTPYANGFVGYIHECKLYSNDVLIRDFIPVKRISDNVVGMYDIVTKTFFTNAGTDSFIAGEKLVNDRIESVAEMEENLVNTATIYKDLLEKGNVGSLFNPTESVYYDVYKMEIQPNTEYVFNLVGLNEAPWIRILDKDNIIVKLQNLSSSGLSYIWSVKPGDNYYYLVYNRPKSSTGAFRVYKKENPYPVKIKINEESNQINLPIPLRSLPNGTCDTIEGNKLVQRVGKVVIDENIVVSSFTLRTDTFRVGLRVGAKPNVAESTIVTLSDKLQYSSSVYGADREGMYVSLSGILYLSLKIDEYGNTLDEFLIKIKENPITVYYELATPIETEIIPDMILINGEPITDTVGIELPNGIRDSIENDIYTKRVGKVIIDGKNGTYQRSGTSSSKLDVYIVRKLGINITLKALDTNYTYQCDSEIDMSKYITVGKWISDSTSGSVVFKVPTEEYLWSDIFNAFLENPITLYVELATPVKIPLFSIKEGLTILKSTNNITPQIELDCLVRNDFQNMCDNEWERGDIVYGTGAIDDTNSRRIRLINYIKVKSNTTYKIDITNLVQGSAIALRCYDISKTYIFSGSGAIGKISEAPLYFTTPENCYYIRFIVETTYANFKLYLKEVIK